MWVGRGRVVDRQHALGRRSSALRQALLAIL